MLYLDVRLGLIVRVAYEGVLCNTIELPPARLPPIYAQAARTMHLNDR